MSVMHGERLIILIFGTNAHHTPKYFCVKKM